MSMDVFGFYLNGHEHAGSAHELKYHLVTVCDMCCCLSSDYYAKDMLGLQIEQEALREVVRYNHVIMLCICNCLRIICNTTADTYSLVGVEQHLSR